MSSKINPSRNSDLTDGILRRAFLFLILPTIVFQRERFKFSYVNSSFFQASKESPVGKIVYLVQNGLDISSARRA